MRNVIRVMSLIMAVVMSFIGAAYAATPTPAAFAYVEPNTAVNGQLQLYSYRLNASGTGDIIEARIKVPSGVSGVTGVSSSMIGASVNYLAGEIIITYSTPWSLASNPNFDVISFSAASDPGSKYYGSYLNGLIDAQGNTPNGFSQYVSILTATPTSTISPTISPTPTITVTVFGTYTITETFSVTPTITQTLTISNTPNWSRTPTSTVTHTITGEPPTKTITPSITRTVTKTSTPTSTKTITPSATQTVTATVSPSATPTVTITNTITIKGIDVEVTDFSGYSAASGQQNIAMSYISYTNIGGFQEDVTGTVVTFKDSEGYTINISDILSDIYFVDSSGNTVYSSAAPSSSALTVPYAPALTVPLQAKRSIYIYADVKNTTFTASFSAGVEGPADVGAAVPVAARAPFSFPLYPANIELKKRTQVLEVSAYDLVPPFVSTGQSNVETLAVVFSNPGGIDYSASLVNGVTLTVKNNIGTGIPADSAIAEIEIWDEEHMYFSAPVITSASTVYCAFAEPIIVEANAEKTMFIFADITGNTVTRSGEFKLSLDSVNDLAMSEYHYGLPVTAYAKAGYTEPFDTNTMLIQNRATQIEVSHLNNMPLFVSTGQSDVDTMNIIFHNKGNTYTASAMVTRLNFYLYDAMDNPVGPSNVITSLKVTDETGATEFGGTTAVFDARVTLNFSEPVVIAGDSSVTLCVRADIVSSYNATPFKIQLVSSDDVYAIDSNIFTTIPVTSPSLFPKETGLTSIQERALSMQVDNFESNIPVGVVKGQSWVPVASFSISNLNGILSAPAEFAGVNLKIKDSSGDDIAANSVISGIYAVDGSGNTIASISPGVGNVITLNNTIPYSIPFGSAVSVSVFADILTTATSSDFNLSIESENDIFIRDTNSGDESVKTSGSVFPWVTSNASVFSSPATDIIAGGDGNIAPSLVGKGQPGVKLMILEFYNPGTAGVADVHIEGVTLTALDSVDAVIPPSSVISALRIIDADNGSVYGTVNTSAMSTPVLFYLDLNALPMLIPASNTLNAYLEADISVSSTQNNFKLRINSENDFEAHSSPSGALTISPYVSMPFPVDSKITTISSFALGFDMGHRDLKPISAEKGKQGIAMMDVLFDNVNASPIAVTSVAVSVKDDKGNYINADSVISNSYLVDSSGNSIAATAAASSHLIVLQPSQFSVAAGSTGYFTVVVDLKAGAEGVFYIEVEDASALGTLPLTNINPMVGEYFGNMRSSTLSIQAADFEESVHGFPNPFSPLSQDAIIEYYIKNNSTVSIRVFSVSGKLVKTVAEQSDRNSGLNNSDVWDGTNESGHSVRSGVYFVQVEAVDKTTGEKKSKVSKLVLLR